MFNDDYLLDEVATIIGLLKEDATAAEEEIDDIQLLSDEFKDWTDQVVDKTLDSSGPVYTSAYLDKAVTDFCQPLAANMQEVVCRLEAMYSDESRAYLSVQRCTFLDREAGLLLTDDLDTSYEAAKMIGRRLPPMVQQCLDNLKLLVYPHKKSRYEAAFEGMLKRLLKVLPP